MSFNLENTFIPDVSAGLLLFYLALLGNYTGNIIPHDLTKFLTGSRIAQHCIAFCMLVFTINLYSKNKPFHSVLRSGAMLYIWFLFTSKQHLGISLAIILLLLVSYIAFNVQNGLQYDTELDDSIRTKRKEQLIRLQNICFYLIITVALVGGVSYFIEHYHRYAQNYNSFMTFLWNYLIR